MERIRESNVFQARTDALYQQQAALRTAFHVKLGAGETDLELSGEPAPDLCQQVEVLYAVYREALADYVAASELMQHHYETKLKPASDRFEALRKAVADTN